MTETESHRTADTPSGPSSPVSHSSSPLVSILIATCDRPEPLLRCLRSALSQNYPNLEILVLDDVSQKHDIAELLKAKIKDSRVRYLRSDTTRGVAGSRNFLMREAKGDTFCVIDDDAYFADTECVSRMVEALSRNLEVGVLAFKVVDHREGREDLLVPFSRRWLRKDPQLTERPGPVSYYLGGCHAIRRGVIERCGLYQEDLMFGGEELDLSYRAIQDGFKIMYLPDVVAHHYPEPSVVGSQTNRRRLEHYFIIRNRFFLAHKYLPIVYVPFYLGIRFMVEGYSAMKCGALREFLSGVVEGIRQGINLKRTPLNQKAVRYLKSHYGRLWY